MQILKPQTGDFYIYSLGRVTSNQENLVYQTILGSGNLGSKVGERNLGTNN